MKQRAFRHIILLTGLLLLSGMNLFSQTVPQGFKYQTTVRDASGLILPAQPVSIRFSFYSVSPTGTLEWQEDHALVTDAYGWIRTIIGTGTTTGAGSVSSFNQLDWSTGIYYLKVSVDLTGGSSFTDYGTSQLFSVPYAFYSQKTATAPVPRLSQFADVDTTGIATGKLLKWNGSYWMPSVDLHRDTVSFSINSGHSATADTASYVILTTTADTVLFAYQSDTALFAGTSQNVTNTSSSVHADTAIYAFASSPTAWRRTGNASLTSSKYIGTNDSTSFTIRSNNTARAKITATGNLMIANAVDNGRFSLLSNDGLLALGTHGTGVLSMSGAGDKMIWYPAKAAFRAGYVSGNQWDSASIGHYSFATGYNTTAKDYSITTGNACLGGDYTVSMGRKSQATALGAYPNGSGVALGDSNLAPGQRCVVIGDGNFANASTCVAIGSKNMAGTGVSTAIGTSCNAVGSYSTAMGYHASVNTRTGSFVYADASSATATLSSAHYQFKVRASGGIIFYTDSAQTMGVSIAPGSGSWSTVSDVHKKENFKNVDIENTLVKIEQLKMKSWKYDSEKRSIRHIGPMAQDFYAAFGFGESDSTITGVDMDGVILAGIKALNFRVENLTEKISTEEIKENIEKQTEMDNSLNKRLDAIDAALNKKTK